MTSTGIRKKQKGARIPEVKKRKKRAPTENEASNQADLNIVYHDDTGMNYTISPRPRKDR